MENTKRHPVIHLLSVSLMLMVSIGAWADWRISHVAPGQDLGIYAPQRMILTDPETGEVHVFFYGHAVTHAIIDGDDVEWDIVDPRAQGSGPISAAWTPDGRLGVAWVDVITRRIYVAIEDGGGGWDIRGIDSGAYYPAGWAGVGLAFDADGVPLLIVLAYTYSETDARLRLIRFTDTPSVLFEQTANVAAEIARGNGGDVWFMYTSGFDGGLGTFDPISGLLWEDWTEWPLTWGDDGTAASPGIALWPNGAGIGGVLVRTTEEYLGGEGDTYVYCRSLRHFESEMEGQFQDLPLPFDMPDRIDAVAGWAGDDLGFSVVMSNGGRIVLAEYDANAALTPDSTVLEVSSAYSIIGDESLRLDAARGADGLPRAAFIANGRLELVSPDDDWTRRTLTESRVTRQPNIWVDPSSSTQVVEILSLTMTDEPKLRLDRFDSEWTTTTWPLPVEPDQFEDHCNLSAARAEDGTWYALLEYHYGSGWRGAVLRLVDDEWVSVPLPLTIEGHNLPRMRKGADGEIYLGLRTEGGYQVLRRDGGDWSVFDSTDDISPTLTEHGDFDVDANGDIHVLSTTSLGFGLRYFHHDAGTDHWSRETVDDPAGRCGPDAQIRIVPASDGTAVTGMCVDRWIASGDDGMLTAFVRPTAGEWSDVSVFSGMWSGPDWGIDGVWTGGAARFVTSHEGRMHLVDVDGLVVDDEAVEGAIGEGAIDALVTPTGDDFIAYEAAAGVAIAYPFDLGEDLERVWTPPVPGSATPMQELPLDRTEHPCSDPGDDDDIADDDMVDDDTDDDDTDDDTLDDDGSPIDDDAGSTDDDAEMDHAHHGDSDSDDSSWCG